LEEKARELGFSLSELTGTAAPRKRAPASAKYANPADSSDTWSGRGRKPRWFDAAIKAGKKPEDMAI
jgi:DNA-binding protein H-NS